MALAGGRLQDTATPEAIKKQTELMQKQIQDAEKEAKSAKWFAVLALIVSAVSLIPDWITLCKNWSDKSVEASVQPLKELAEKQLIQLQINNNKLDSISNELRKLKKANSDTQ